MQEDSDGNTVATRMLLRRECCYDENVVATIHGKSETASAIPTGGTYKEGSFAQVGNPLTPFVLTDPRLKFDCNMHRTFAALLITISLCCDAVQAVSPVVDVGYTKYEGSSGTNGITQWLGIRFAAPPLGDLRYAAPADPPRNETTQVADKVGSPL